MADPTAQPAADAAAGGEDRDSMSFAFEHMLTPPLTPPVESKGFFARLLGGLVGGGEQAEAQQQHAEAATYWQNYDLNTSTAPDLFRPEDMDQLNKLKSGLNVMAMRARIQKRIALKDKRHQDRAAARIQALARQWLVMRRLPELVAQIEKHIKAVGNIRQFKRELLERGIPLGEFSSESGSITAALLRPNANRNALIWRKSAINQGCSIPLHKLKACYAGYPRTNFPTPAMVARRTRLPDPERTFTIQRDDTGENLVFLVRAAKDRAGVVRGLAAVVAEVNSPEAFYFDERGCVRRVTRSIFDPGGNTAVKEARRSARAERMEARKKQLAACEEARKQRASTLRMRRERAVAREAKANGTDIEATAPPDGEAAAAAGDGGTAATAAVDGAGAGADDMALGSQHSRARSTWSSRMPAGLRISSPRFSSTLTHSLKGGLRSPFGKRSPSASPPAPGSPATAAGGAPELVLPSGLPPMGAVPEEGRADLLRGSQQLAGIYSASRSSMASSSTTVSSAARNPQQHASAARGTGSPAVGSAGAPGVGGRAGVVLSSSSSGSDGDESSLSDEGSSVGASAFEYQFQEVGIDVDAVDYVAGAAVGLANGDGSGESESESESSSEYQSEDEYGSGSGEEASARGSKVGGAAAAAPKKAAAGRKGG